MLRNKKIFLFGLIVLIFASLAWCKYETSTSYGLSIDNTALAKLEPGDKLAKVENDTFAPGDKVCYILINVKKFKKGSDGLNWFDMDIEVKDPQGKVILSKQQMLGERGHVALPDDTAESPFGVFVTNSSLAPGRYQIKLTIYDKIGKTSASKSTTFILK